MIEITGTIINYYFHCKRQCWLFANKINLEDNSELVKIGKEIHKNELENQNNSEISINNVKVDKITKTHLIEIKKSDADFQAARWQLIYYLSKLEEVGIKRKGKLIFKEKNKLDRKVHEIQFTNDLRIELQGIIKDVRELIESEKPDEPTKTSKCKKCAYYEFCIW